MKIKRTMIMEGPEEIVRRHQNRGLLTKEGEVYDSGDGYTLTLVKDEVIEPEMTPAETLLKAVQEAKSALGGYISQGLSISNVNKAYSILDDARLKAVRAGVRIIR